MGFSMRSNGDSVCGEVPNFASSQHLARMLDPIQVNLERGKRCFDLRFPQLGSAPHDLPDQYRILNVTCSVAHEERIQRGKVSLMKPPFHVGPKKIFSPETLATPNDVRGYEDGSGNAVLSQQRQSIVAVVGIAVVERDQQAPWRERACSLQRGLDVIKFNQRVMASKERQTLIEHVVGKRPCVQGCPPARIVSLQNAVKHRNRQDLTVANPVVER